MPRNPNPIPPRLGDMRKYEEALRRAYLQPMFRRLAERLAQAEGANQAYRAMDDIVEAMAALPQHGIPTEYIQTALKPHERLPLHPRYSDLPGGAWR